MNAYLIKIAQVNSESVIRSADAVQKTIKDAQNNTNRILNLDESWCGIHFVMTGEYPIPRQEALQRGISWDDDSLENVLMGGSPTQYRTKLDVARYLKPKEVAKVAEKLSNLTVKQFEEWYDPEALMEEHIPPEIWDEGSEPRGWLISYFMKLVEFYKATTASGEGLLIYID